MKKRSFLANIPAIIFFIALTGLASCGSAQQATGAKEPVAVSIDSGRWVFTVQMIKPMEGMNSQPNGTYSVIFRPNNFNVYLPYFGRAFNAAEVYGTGKSALDFISKDFTVEKEKQDDDKWRIVIKPKDQPQVQSMTFVFFSNGSASLDVLLTNRSPISYSGIVGRAK